MLHWVFALIRKDLSFIPVGNFQAALGSTSGWQVQPCFPSSCSKNIYYIKNKGGSEAWKRRRAELAVGGIQERCWAGSLCLLIFMPFNPSKSCGTGSKMVLLTPKNLIVLGKSGKQPGIKGNLFHL